MKKFQLLHLLICISLTTTPTESLRYAKTGCEDTCGNVLIPYPFGIGSHCSINKWYVVDCNSSKPYLSAFNNLEVLSVSLVQQTVTVNVSMISDCRNPIWNLSCISVDDPEAPFLISKLDNIFVVKGCGNAVITDHQGTIVTGCSTTCGNDTVSDQNNCYGVGCCQTTIPRYLRSLSMNLTGLFSDQNNCFGVGYFVDYNSYLNGTTFRRQSITKNVSFVPVSLAWVVTDRDTYDELATNSQSRCASYLLDVGDGTSVNTLWCDCRITSEGNPYLKNGCKDEEEECIKCERSGGFCYYKQSDVMSCVEDSSAFGRSKTSLNIILSVTLSIGLLFLAIFMYASYKFVKKVKARRQKQRFFKRNGGLLLKQQHGSNFCLVDKIMLFTSVEIEKATQHFNENRIIGRGGQSIVYKGMLTDGRIVAIKKAKVVDENQIEQFINELVVLSQVNHRNVVKVLGCCLETEVPLLVSEFVSNGTLYGLIQNESKDVLFSLKMRLQIATDVAGALSYLHSSTSTPIYHRDIKTTNILLDEKYRAKVSDFGTSRFISIGKTHLTTLVKGTFGYFDPEYFKSSRFTEKSDVYSFGVVLLELLTKEKPISINNYGEPTSLSTHFMLALEEDRVMSIFDATIVKDGSREELLAIANLAMRCLDSNGKNRPTMKEVATELEAIRMSHVPAVVQASCSDTEYIDDFSMMTYDEQISLTMDFGETDSI